MSVGQNVFLLFQFNCIYVTIDSRSCIAFVQHIRTFNICCHLVQNTV